MNKSIREINQYLRAQNWVGTDLRCNDFYEKRSWNKFKSNQEAYTWFKKHRNSMFESIKAEFQANHSAMSYRGAQAYADNWN